MVFTFVFSADTSQNVALLSSEKTCSNGGAGFRVVHHHKSQTIA